MEALVAIYGEYGCNSSLLVSQLIVEHKIIELKSNIKDRDILYLNWIKSQRNEIIKLLLISGRTSLRQNTVVSAIIFIMCCAG